MLAQLPNSMAAQTERELLDSVVYVETYMGTIYSGDKKMWEYDADGNKTQYSWYYWSTSDEVWKGRQRLDSIYDDKGNVSTLVFYSWNSEKGQWSTNKKDEMSYNTDGELILYYSSSWNHETGEWDLELKQESTHTYTEDNNHVVSSIVYNFNVETGEWTPHHRNELNYDSNGKRTLYNSSRLDSATNTWVFKVGSFKYENSYDKQGNQTLSAYYTWDGETNQWKGLNNLNETSYDLHGNAILVLSKEWDKSLNQWVISGKSENSYNVTGLRLEQITSKWESTNGDWIAVNKTKNSFNEIGALTGVIESEWNKEDSLWLDVMKQEMIYNANGKVLLVTNYMLDEQSGDFIKSDDSEYIYNESGDKLIEEATSYYYDGISYVCKTNYYYSIHTFTSVFDIETVSPVFYPNPFNDQLSIQLNNNHNYVLFELFNFQGQKVMSKHVLNSETISVASLASGVYFYQLSLDNKTHNGKLIKK